MKRLLVLPFVFSSALAPIAATPATAPFDRFTGSWNCARVDGATGHMLFSSVADDLRLRVDWKNGGNTFAFDHVFTLGADGNWTTTQMNAAKTSTFTGNSSGFDGDSVTFTGTRRVGDRRYAERESFRFTSDSTFQHIWYGQNDNGQWQPTGYQECTKV